ncbi:MAG: cisplatin damage response ATP-dependent DNA ligase [Alphaproteobacteria bacterium]|nr:cisplatin damage response ATP-dependent DNA ligase [Alphaproteobacteria bacterium]
MKRFARLLDALVYTPSRNGKLRLLADYFTAAPDPDRGWALAALTDGLAQRQVKPALVRELVERRVDPVLFRLSYDYVGDLAETVSLIWPGNPARNAEPDLSEIVERLRVAARTEVPGLLAGWLDALDATGRYALLKLLMGGMRVGVSARLAKTALAMTGAASLEQIEEIWFGLEPPYLSLFAWLEGKAGPPAVDQRLAFRSPMLANPVELADLEPLDPADFRAEWKWDGIRVQLVAGGSEARLYSRNGEDIGAAFPDILGDAKFDAVLDGELLVLRDGAVAPFNDLQQRLNRKTVTARMLADFPAHIRLYDILFEDGGDLRRLPFDERRRRLERWHGRIVPPRTDLSPLVPFAAWRELASLRDAARADGVEGLMLKRRDSAYAAGRPQGPWFKWKRDPLLADCVLMYAQRGHGRRSSYYSDFTFGCWRGGAEGAAELVPVGKAYFGFTDAELVEIDRWVRAHSTERFGPVRAVEPGLVFEVAFDSIQRSSRHKSKLAMRFPRIHRIRWDKPHAEADRLETLEKLLNP